MIANPNNFRVRALASLRKTALKRHPGYLEECMRRGQLDVGAQTVTFTLQDFQDIRRLYNPKTSAMPPIAGCC